MGHWIAFLIYPQDGRANILDSLRNTNKEGYKDFESVLRYAIVSDGTYSFTLNIHDVTLSLTLVVFVQHLQEVRARPRVLGSKI